MLKRLLVILAFPACGSPPPSGMPLVTAATSGETGQTGDEESGEPEPADPCDPGGGPRTITLAGNGESMPDHVTGLAMVGEAAVACGDGFVSVIGGSSVDLDGDCRGIAAVGDDSVVAATRDTVLLLHVADHDLEELDRVLPSDTVRDVGSDGEGSVAVVTPQALEIFDVSGGSIADGESLSGPESGRGVAWTDHGWLVADGNAGAKLIGVGGGVEATLPDAKNAIGVAADGEDAILLRGGYGFDAVVVDSDALSSSATIPTEGTGIAGAVSDGVALVITGAGLHRYELGTEVELSGRIPRPDVGELDGAWFRAVALSKEGAAAGVGDEVFDLRVTDADEGGVMLADRVTTSLYGGDGAEVVVLLRNAGNGELLIGEIDVSAPLDVASVEGGEDSDDCDGLTRLEPGATLLLTLGGDLDGEGEAELVVETSDPNVPELHAAMAINTPTISEGAPVDFTGLTLDGDFFSLDDVRGEVVFLKLFAPS